MQKFIVMTISASLAVSAAANETAAKQARATSEFLDSIGIVTTMPDRGQPVEKTIEMINYCGFRWVRAGIEGLSEKEGGATTIDVYLRLCREAGVKVNWGLVSGGSDLDKLLRTARPLHEAGVLLAFEGNNEPNNWGVVYQGERGGWGESWVALAKLQRDFYARVKADPDFKNYPVWGASDMGAQIDNVGLQYMEIPEGADTVMPAGTKYSDAVNVHNYIYHQNSPGLEDNKTWTASDPGVNHKLNSLWVNHGITWRNKHKGYTEEELRTIPRVTTETGMTIGDKITEELHGLHLTSIYLAQFARGWSHTSVYLLRDRTDEGGNQKFGFYAPDYTPRKAAHYLHNLTAALKDDGVKKDPGKLAYVIENQTDTTHDLLLQHSTGKFQLVVWAEKVEGSEDVVVKFDAPRNVKVFNTVKGTDPVETLVGVKEVKLLMSNHAYVLEIE